MTPPELTERYQFVLDFVREHEPTIAHDVGEAATREFGWHPGYGTRNGEQILRNLEKKGLVRLEPGVGWVVRAEDE